MNRIAARLLLAAAVVATLVVAAPGPALACSCAAPDPARMIADSEAAFVGVLTGPPRSTGDFEGDWPFAVEEWVKGDLGETIEVRSPLDGAACGFEIAEGARVGVLLYRHQGELTSGLCSTVAADVLLAAAVPPGPPDGEGPIAFLVAGSAGPYRMVALDAQGRDLARADGHGNVYELSVCPGERFVAELADERVLAVRDLETFTIAWQQALPGPDRWYADIECTDGDGGRVLAFSPGQEQPAVRSEVLSVTPDGVDVVADGNWEQGVLAGGRLFAVAAGEPQVSVVELASGAETPLYTLGTTANFAGIESLAVAPGGGKVAFTAFEWDEDLNRSMFHVVDVASGELASLPGSGRALWIDDETLMVDAGPIKVLYDVAGSELEQLAVRQWDFAAAASGGDTVYGWVWPGGVLQQASLGSDETTTLRTLPTSQTNALAVLADGPVTDPQPGPTPTTRPPLTTVPGPTTTSTTTSSTPSTTTTVAAAGPPASGSGGSGVPWPAVGAAALAAAVAAVALTWTRRSGRP